ncbi:MAG TPA: hypothetical protein VG034_05390 [Acidimicrobiia bacterium]|nr:hypothetical protein [Acidimicrobiia bacterium]
MSKRSYRRLAVVAGAALALGSMAPAMATRVGGDADAEVSADTINVSSLLSGVQSNQLPTGLVLNTVGSVKQTALSTAFLTLGDVHTIVGDAVSGVTCVAGAGTSAVLGLGAGVLADAGVGVGLGGVHVGLGVDALVGAPIVLVGDVTECLGDIKGDFLATVGHAQVAAGAVTQLATGAALSAVGAVQSLPSAAASMATPLLLNDLLNITASGNGAVLASLF